MISIAIYDHENYRLRTAALENLINGFSSMTVIFRDFKSESIINFAKAQLPDVLLITASGLDESLKRTLSGFQSVKDVMKIILITNTVSKWILPNMKSLGIQGYIVMETKSSNLLEGIQQVQLGKMYCCSEVTSVLLGMHCENDMEFSEREKEIIKLLVDDKSSKEIADHLFISVHTVDSHRKSLIKKFKVRSTAGLVRRALETGYA